MKKIQCFVICLILILEFIPKILTSQENKETINEKIGLKIRPFPGLGTTFVNLEDYANRGTNIHPLQVIKLRTGIQLLYDIGNEIDIGIEISYLPLYSLDGVNGTSVNLDAEALKFGIFSEIEVAGVMMQQLGASVYINTGDDVPNKFDDKVNFGIMYGMGTKIDLSQLITLNPTIKFDFIFANQFTVGFSMVLGLTFNL